MRRTGGPVIKKTGAHHAFYRPIPLLDSLNQFHYNIPIFSYFGNIISMSELTNVPELLIKERIDHLKHVKSIALSIYLAGLKDQGSSDESSES